MNLLHQISFMLMALAAGAFFPTQAGINHQLTSWTRSPLMSSTISFAVGTLVLAVCVVIMRIPVSDLSEIRSHPWWIWTGGALGAYIVYSLVFLAPRLGATSMLACILAGQMVAAVLLDRFGVLGYAQQTVGIPKIAGLVLIFIGVLMIRGV